jgi:hypothetical protein
MQSVVIHAHLYQPPREDPWLDVLEREHGAAPYHDWNARIEDECYRAMVAARILDRNGRIARVVNLLERLSFNVGASLLGWLEREAPATYQGILHADAESRRRLGHGNAMAMPYHHIILPLASRRDKVTEVRWGIRDFRRRFGRDPEGMWLPETAADDETLDVLALEGIAFTVVAPHQVKRRPLYGLPGVARTSGGHRIAVIPYDGATSHDVAFGPLLRDAEAWAARMVLPPDDIGGPKLVALATDGETFGHHHKFSEMALAATLDRLGHTPVRIENFASFLAAHPPRDAVVLTGAGSWSCSHGVERWRADCGCRTAAGTSQAWRAPLRQATDHLKAEVDARFEAEGASLVADPWAARDAHDRDARSDHPIRFRELLEMQWHALAMFTSCGWFFDDLSGLETLIILRHAARATELAGEDGPALLAEFRAALRSAASNESAAGSGADILDQQVLPRHPAEVRAAGGVAILATHAPTEVPLVVAGFEVLEARPERVRIRHGRTGREWRFRVTMGGTPSTDLDVRLVEGDGDGPERALTLRDVPEPAREALRRHAQARLLPAVFDPGERDAVAAGVLPYAQALQHAMLRHLGEYPATVNHDAVRAALDLLALDRRPVPFDVQTKFYELCRQAMGRDRERLNRYLAEFGFSDPLPDGD